MANLQICISDELKAQADSLFASLGFDTSTAVRIFLTAAVENNGLPFEVRHKTVPENIRQAVNESRNRVNLNGPYNTAEEAVAAMLEE